MPDTIREPSGARPVIEQLTRVECLDVLREETHGRLAFTRHGVVDIEPIHYVLEGEWLYARTSPGTKVTTLRHGPWVAFEVDRVRGPFDWASVVVKGTVYFVPESTLGGDPRMYEHVLARLRQLMPQALSPGDPAPERDILLRISLNEVSGRRARTTEDS